MQQYNLQSDSSLSHVSNFSLFVLPDSVGTVNSIDQCQTRTRSDSIMKPSQKLQNCLYPGTPGMFFSFGHCTNYLPPVPPPPNSGMLYNFFLTPKNLNFNLNYWLKMKNLTKQVRLPLNGKMQFKVY